MIDERTLEFEIFGAMIRGRITWPSVNTAELISQDITKNFKIISSAVPVYYFRLISQAVRGNVITVGGISGYENFELTEKDDNFSMFLLDISFNQRCRIDNKPCNF